ncbi:MAG: hypothetical protein ACOVNR_06225 [Chitinophagaceae bacterium]
MLTKEEENFISYWEKERQKPKLSFFTYLKGFYRGLAVALGIMVLIAIGWNERAVMVANAKMSNIIFVIALLLIALFMGWLYNNFQWEAKEQQYLEYKAKADAANRTNSTD